MNITRSAIAASFVPDPALVPGLSRPTLSRTGEGGVPLSTVGVLA